MEATNQTETSEQLRSVTVPLSESEFRIVKALCALKGRNVRDVGRELFATWAKRLEPELPKQDD